jgi:hypothetical protein
VRRKGNLFFELNEYSFLLSGCRSFQRIKLKDIFPGNSNWHDIDTSFVMMQFLKYLFLENKVEATGFKLAPAFMMIFLFLLFHAFIIYILLSTMLGL